MFKEQNLPQLDADTARHCERVLSAIRQYIYEQGGAIRFDDYMRMALYEPGLGYYMAGARKFGADGDFVTAPELGPLFGAALAAQCSQVLRDVTDGEIVEFGGGSGQLALSVLSALATEGVLPARYTIVELSPDLRQRQQQLIRDSLPQLFERVQWSSSPPPAPILGCVIANEILDALPVRLFNNQDGEIVESWVALDDAEQLTWQTRTADEAVLETLRSHPDYSMCLTENGYRFEICPALSLWVADLTNLMHQGLGLLIDYGSGRRERFSQAYAPGSLRCFLQHRVHDQALIYPGGQDITASVDFTSVAEAAVDAGLQVAGFVEQVHFLTSCGILHNVEALQRGADEQTVLKLNEQLKTLLMPNKMGTRFKVLALTKDYHAALLGFQRRDDRRLL